MRVHEFKFERRVGDWVAANTRGSKTVVDFGAGKFNYIYTANADKRIGIEIFEPYVRDAISQNPPGIEIFLADMTKFDEYIPVDERDTAMMIDTLEHLDRESGENLLSRVQRDFNKILIFMPCGEHPQHAIDGNPHQEHKSTWTAEDLRALGFNVEVDPDFHVPYKRSGNMSAMYAVWHKRPATTDSVLHKFHKPFVKRYRKDEYTNSTPDTVSMCAMSPISNKAIVCEDGWVEERDDSEIYRYFENEAELFALHCQHNAWLAERGYFDFDPATINFFKPSNVYFDKSATMPIGDIQDKHIDCYFILLHQSYKTINQERQDKIRKALETRNAETIRNVFDNH